MDVSSVLRESFNKYSKNLKTTVTLGVILYVVPHIILLAYNYSAGNLRGLNNELFMVENIPYIYVIIQILAGILMMLLGLLWTISIIQTMQGNVKQPLIGNIMARAWSSFLPALAISLLMQLIFLAILLPFGAMFFVIQNSIFIIVLMPLIALILFAAIIVLGVYWVFAVYAVIVDNVPVTAALGYSMNLVKRSWWRTFGYMLLLAALAVGVAMPMVLFALLFMIIPSFLALMMSNLVTYGFYLFFKPYAVAYWYQYYEGLKAEKHPKIGQTQQ